jgi:lysophospholipase L1-like esterase
LGIICLLWASYCHGQDSDQVICNRPWKIVVLGSSTAFGTGASVSDSAWVYKFRAYVKRINSASQVYNLGIPGLKTYQNLRPNGYLPPPSRPVPYVGFNISTALTYNPDAIIINMPSNDAANNYTIAEQQANFEAVLQIADSAGISVWVTTTQPRNGMTSDQMLSLTTMRDWILTRFGNNAIDFWDGIANSNGTINSLYYFDNVHLNNAGHEILYRRTQQELIIDSLCRKYLGVLSVDAGTYQSLPHGTSSLTLNGSANSTKATITNVNWLLISGPNTPVISFPTQYATTVNGLTTGVYQFSLNVTDSKGNIKSDTMQVEVRCGENDTIVQSICHDDLPYKWDGVSYHEGGMFTRNYQRQSGCDSIVTLNLNISSCGKTGITVRVKLEQFIESGNRMKPYLFDQGKTTDSLLVDSIQLSLWKPNNLNALNPDFTQKIILNRDGWAFADFPSGTTGQIYYLSFHHRNSIQIWSHSFHLLDSLNVFNFCLFSNIFQNTGSNSVVTLNNGEMAMTTGDINQDGSIDLYDLQLVENAASNFYFGYYPQDCNGDGSVDLADLQVVENKVSDFIYASKP